MTTLTLSPGGQVTLPPEVLQQNTWKHTHQLVMLCLGDILVLRPAHSPKTDNEEGDQGDKATLWTPGKPPVHLDLFHYSLFDHDSF